MRRNKKKVFVNKEGNVREPVVYWPYETSIPELARGELLKKFNKGESIEKMSERLQFLRGVGVRNPDAVAVHEAILVTYLIKSQSKLSPSARKRLSEEVRRLRKQGVRFTHKRGGKLIIQ